MRRLIIFLVLFVCSCSPISKFKKDNNVNIKSHTFKQLDLDGNGTVDPLEFYSSIDNINSVTPAYGLGLILLSVIICAFGSSLFYRSRK
jgi:hypothetical protein